MDADSTTANFGYVTPENLAAFTDLYELTMLQGYRGTGHDPEATFSLYVRDLPPNRGYLVAAGLEQVVHYLDTLSFSERILDYLAELDFSGDFLDYLADFEFTGDVRAIPEGTPVFPDEPLLEVTAPMSEAQLLETFAINQLGYQTLVATKAARMRDVVTRHGDGQSLADFGSRRAHGTDAGVKLARAAYVGGFDSTSNVAAGELFDLPVTGTMAHSWIQSFDSEREAFEAFVDVYGEDSILLVDTYDTVDGARTAQAVADEHGVDITGVRIDSGDLAELSKAVDEVVDSGVFVSSGMDEYAIREFFDAGGVATGFGPGTALATSVDAPKLEAVYKLVEVERDGELEPTMKLSPGKVTYPGKKSVRRFEVDGVYDCDVLGLAGEPTDVAAEELLVPVYEDGSRVYDLPSLDDLRERTLERVRKLPEGVRDIENPDVYFVETSDRLSELTDRLSAELSEKH